MTTTFYEVLGKGVIMYAEAHVIEGYAASVRLLGFNEQDPEFQKRKSQLEELSKQGNVENS